MPYPAKTNSHEILNEAIRQLELVGGERLSIRAVAAALGLAPNALYRYYADRDALLAAVADEGGRLLLAALAAAGSGSAGSGSAGVTAVRAVADAYLDFARSRPALYRTIMTDHVYAKGVRPAYDDLWDFSVGLLRDVAGEENAPQAAVAMWALLHGATVLEAAGVLAEKKPAGGIAFGLDALLAGIVSSAGD